MVLSLGNKIEYQLRTRVYSIKQGGQRRPQREGDMGAEAQGRLEGSKGGWLWGQRRGTSRGDGGGGGKREKQDQSSFYACP